jgi:hypothetical protein
MAGIKLTLNTQWCGLLQQGLGRRIEFGLIAFEANEIVALMVL